MRVVVRIDRYRPSDSILLGAALAVLSTVPAQAQSRNAHGGDEDIVVTADRQGSFGADFVQAGTFRDARLLDTPLTAEQHNYAAAVRSSADALLTIINDIFDFSKIEAGKLTIEPLAFYLRVAVEEAVDLLAPKAEEQGID